LVKDIVPRLCSGWIQYTHEEFSGCKTVYLPSFTQQNATDLHNVDTAP